MSRTSASPPHRFRGYAVPRADNESLCDPSPDRAIADLRANAASLGRSEAVIDGSPLASIREGVRQALVESAYEWTAGCVAASGDADQGAAARALEMLRGRVDAFLAARGGAAQMPLILGGHQPEFYHPGVWFKNLVAARLACRAGAVAVNLLVDHDIPKRSSIRVPASGANGGLHSRPVRFASLPQGVPWEQLDAESIDLEPDFDRLVARAASAIGGDSSSVAAQWNSVRGLIRGGYRLGESIAAARHAVELRAGWLTLELPLSRLCESRGFGRFVSELTSRADAVREAYNAARADYRAAHRMRSEAHPVPALQVVDQEAVRWVELPLWIYSDLAPRRSAAWLARVGGQWVIGDRAGLSFALHGREEASIAADEWDAMTRAGIKLRPRALTTTTFLRLFAADYFIHGIGGGKYDQLTDLLIRQLWDIEPPKFMVASASVHLPMRFRPQAGVRSERVVRDELRRLRYHPERAVVGGPVDAVQSELLRRKRELLDDIPQRGEKRGWHRQLAAVNARLEAGLSGHRAALERELAAARDLQRQTRTLRSREYALILFDEADLTARLNSLLPCPAVHTAAEV